jgi:uncharacterized membrane protein YoaK (UPF0700 family)
LLNGFIAGYTDTLGFVALFGLFTGHVTGNLVVLGSAVAHDEPGATAKLLALPMFVLGVAATRHVVLVARRRGHVLGRSLRWAEALLMTAFMVVGGMGGMLDGPDAPLALLAGMLGVLTMSVHNARNRMEGGTPNTVMTGNVTQLAIDVMDHAHGLDPADAGKRAQRIRTLAGHVLAFIGGAACGTLGYVGFGFWALALPIAALVLQPQPAPLAVPAATPVKP